jgi:hypothetical protein
MVGTGIRTRRVVMAVGLILQFPVGLGESEYDTVNKAMGLDPRSGAGEWPAGLIAHTAGMSEQGWVVTEVWESKERQGAFMAERLGPQLATLPAPQVTWYEVVAEHRPG